MNIAYLLKRYFADCSKDAMIEVFDNKNIYNVYTDIVNTLGQNPDIELGVMQALSYCFYEILDNVLTHSTKNCGTAILNFDKQRRNIKILVADDGIGIEASLKENSIYSGITKEEALELCIKDNISDGKGMGFGLFSTFMLVSNAGIRLYVHSGDRILVYDGKDTFVRRTDPWPGTVICMELKSDIELDSSQILEDRVDAESEYNDTFLEENDLDDLW